MPLLGSIGGGSSKGFGAQANLNYLIRNSLRFRSSASAYLNRTPTVAGNQQKFTWSGWIKRGSDFGSQSEFFTAGTSSTNYITFQFDASNRLTLGSETPSLVCNLRTTSVYRDPAAWYHVVLAVDTTQATAANRVKLYVNGNQISAFDTSTYPTQNTNLLVNSVIAHYFAKNTSGGGYFDGYLSDVYFIDGQQLDPYYFGSNDENNIWKPIKYYGMYGTNGFHLDFTNTTSTTTIGYDSSPNGNNWTANNISLTAGTTYDAMTDVPTNTSATQANYAVMNPLWKGSTISIVDGNLKVTESSSSGSGANSTISVSSGKYYWEVTVLGVEGGNSYPRIGVGATIEQTAGNTFLMALGWRPDGTVSAGGSSYITVNGSPGGTTFTTNDIIQVALDMDNKDRKSTRLNSSHIPLSRMPSSA